jgi:gamma-butyrobetaine dioxygenase
MTETLLGTPSTHLEFVVAGDLQHVPAIWLRDNCPCRTCRDTGTGQKLFDITDIPADPTVAVVATTPETLVVEFAPDGHRSTFSRAWLAEYAPRERAAADGRTEDSKQLWRAADLTGRLPETTWVDYNRDAALKVDKLECVLRLGFLLIRDVPCTPGMVLEVARSFGFVRETNYGRLFDVRVESRPNNLAFTSLRITPHTDNPYRDPVPTVQLLHCLTNSAEGGESGLVDGFLAASLLREYQPAAFATLTRTCVQFAFRDAETILRADRPLIHVDGRKRIREVRYSNRHVQPVQLAGAEVVDFYAAYRRFAEHINAPELQLSFKLDPGDCLIFDNTRVLHARAAFDSVGDRHLQGCYADLDALASMIAVARRGGASTRPITPTIRHSSTSGLPRAVHSST